jgi:RHS repeat-associated protein
LQKDSKSSRAVGEPESGKRPPFAIEPPSVSLPKGGGAIHGMGEKFAANPVTGTGSLTVPIAASPGRAGFGPKLDLSYDSGAGNGFFGLGWNLSLSSIRRKTDKGLPTYRDDLESDTFLLDGAEDLVPKLQETVSGANLDRVVEFVSWNRKRYKVHHYRPRIEGLFARIERWVELGDLSNMFWRTISRDNVTTWYGRTANSRISDPAEPGRIFEWLICQTHDDRGNVATYQYATDVPRQVASNAVWEVNRLPVARMANRYLKRIKYGNTTPFLPAMRPDRADILPAEWLFEVVLDYGDHSLTQPRSQPVSSPAKSHWLNRPDAFSTHRPGFEVRTYRLCRRVLMFHHFAGEPGVGLDCLVRSTEFDYAVATQIESASAAGYTTLQSVTHRSFQRKPGSASQYESRNLPPVGFTYSQPSVDPTVHAIEPAELENLPIGTQGPGYRWLDLNGEGLAGVLAERQGAWHYKANVGEGRFGPMRLVSQQPSFAAASGSGYQFIDLAGDGSIDVVDFGGVTPGFHARDDSQGWKRHVPFANLPNINWQDPNLRFVDLTGDGHADALLTEQEVFTWFPSLDEKGFGSARHSRQGSDEDSGPKLVFADGTQTVFLADMCGDGLTDLVRIQNGNVCYWPNLGYGRFGRKVTLGNSPRFDAPDLFDPERIRLTDIDGSGPVDIIYLGRDGARLYFNRSGNSLSDALHVPLPAAGHNLGSVQVADLLGNGTACLVWNSHLPADTEHPVQYIDLMAGRRTTSIAVAEQRRHEKPHLLIRVDNHLGATTDIEYTPSTRFYLQDQKDGIPWVTRLPFPVQCVSKVVKRDKWRKTEFATSYSYHHGYFDGQEREFRGFGRVEQIDTQAFAEAAVANADSPFYTQNQALYQAPVKTVTWYHTGIAQDRHQILSLFAEEYAPARYADAFSRHGFHEPQLPQPEVEPGNGPALTGDEWREAMRACKGMPMRQEVIELDSKTLQETGLHKPVRLFSAAQHNCHLRRLQPQGPNRHAIFLASESESFTCNYELDLTKTSLDIDPRIAHTFNLKFDEWGNTLQSVAVVYPRRTLFADPRLSSEPQSLIQALQSERHIAYTETRFTDPLPASRIHHRVPMPCEVRTYELTGDDPNDGFIPSASPYFSLDDWHDFQLSDRLVGQGSRTVMTIGYHRQPISAVAHKRLIDHALTLYWADDSNSTSPSVALTFGKHGPRGMKYEDYKLALTEEILDAVFQANATPAGISTSLLAWEAESGRTALDLLGTPARSGYVSGVAIGMPASQYWMRSGIAGFQADACQHFFLPERYVDPFGNTTALKYDARDLYIHATSDARGNTVAVERFDCRVLAPSCLIDVNGNRSDVAFDVLGLPVASAILGKVTPGSVAGTESTQTGDSLASLSFLDLNPTPQAVAAFFLQPDFNTAQTRQWLGKATARFIYHLGEARDNAGKVLSWSITPGSACSVIREQYTSDTLAAAVDPSPLQVAFEYSDGAGQAFAKKQQAESETANGPFRWLTNGKTIVNNKGKPVLQFEPYFSGGGHRFEEPQAVGVSPVMFYDALGRLVRTDQPDGTFSKVEFSPWFSRSFDANDTVLESRWYRERGSPNPATALRRDLAGKLRDDDEFRAAWLAAHHANTPTETHFDSLGREVVAIAHNRSPDPSAKPAIEWSVGDWGWRDEFGLTFTKLDVEGNPMWIRDARGNLVMQYITPPKPTRWVDQSNENLPAGSTLCYDIAGNLLYQHSMDGGDRWMVMDAAGKPMLAWDFNDQGPNTPSQARLYRTDYDALHRPVAQWLKKDDSFPALIEEFNYCDTNTPREANGPSTLAAVRLKNLIGQAVSHFDSSGVATVAQVGLSGQPEQVTRRLILPGATTNTGLLDWNTPDRNNLLETETFYQVTQFDVLGRMTRLFNWHRGEGSRVAVYEPQYNARGLLCSEDLVLRATKTPSGYQEVTETTRTTAIQAVTYNAKGQKLNLELGNATQTRYSYNASNFRLSRIFTRRPPLTFPGDCVSNTVDSVTPTRPCGVQNLHYTYDPVGNITHIQDDAQDAVYFNGQFVEPSNDYTYDALNRLIEATGREQDVAEPPAIREGPWHSASIPSGNQLRNYIQRYQYDTVGNFIEMAHLAGGGSWTRHYANHSDSNRLHQTWVGNVTSEAVTYFYDAHGSILNLNRTVQPLAPDGDWGLHLNWDWRDMICGLDLGGGGLANYQYGIDKQRTRKHITRNAAAGGTFTEDRIYLGGMELYRRRNAQGYVVEEIESLHLFEGEQRVLLVDDVISTDGTRPDGLSVSTRTLQRYQYSNHLGSVGLELDHAAGVISYEEFHPYGTSAFRLTDADSEVPSKRFRFTGMERDEESGLSYHSARYALPIIGRWVCADPVGVFGGFNTYLYADGNCIRMKDSDGYQAKEAGLWNDFEKPGGYRSDWSEFEFWERGKLYRGSSPGELPEVFDIGSGGGKVWWERLAWRTDKSKVRSSSAKEEPALSSPPLVEAPPPPPPPSKKPPQPKKPTEFIFDADTIVGERKGPTEEEIRDEIQGIDKQIRELTPKLNKAMEDAKSETIGAVPFIGWGLATVYDVYRGDYSSAGQNAAEEGVMHFGEKVLEELTKKSFGAVPIVGSAIDVGKMGSALDTAGAMQRKMDSLRWQRYLLKDQLGDPDARYYPPTLPDQFAGPGGKMYNKKTGKPIPRIQD